jgi:hypothetical protein
MRAVGRNLQLAFEFTELFDDPDLGGNREHRAMEDRAMETWLLLYHFTPEEIRAELSLPAGITAAGFVDAWQERIILPAIDLTSAAAERLGVAGTGGAADVMVTVRQR